MPKKPINPINVNGFTKDPPTNGVIVQYKTFNDFVSGFISTNASFSAVVGAGVTVFESSGRAYIAFYRINGANGALRLDYHTSDGTAVNGVDYTAVSGSVNWAAFDIDAKVVQVPLLRTSSIASSFFNFHIDGVFIGAALFPSIYVYRGGNLTPFPGPSYTTAAHSFEVTIQRQGRGELNFVGTPYSVQRPGGTTTVTLQVQRFSGFKGAVGCSFHTTDGTAVDGVAYTGQTGTLSWADSEGGTKNITITILNGGSGTQDFTCTIDTPTGGVSIGSTNIATVNIVAAAPPANPTSRSSIPEQLFDMFLPTDPDGIGDETLFSQNHFVLQDNYQSFWRNSITFDSILSSQVVNGWIGFGGGGSFGGTGDFFDGTDSFDPLPPQSKFDGYITGS